MLTIPLDRDRWEDNPLESEEGIWSVGSTLTIGPVLSQEWTFKEGIDHPEELWTHGIQLDCPIPEDDNAVVHIYSSMDFWRLALTVNQADLHIRLEDAE